MKPSPIHQNTTPSQVLVNNLHSRWKGAFRTPRRIVIVGNGMVSHRFCVEWLKNNPAATDKLTIIGEESLPAYDRIHLTNSLTGAETNTLQLAPREWYESHQITLHLGDRVTQIDRKSRQILTQANTAFDYDVLILATGSSARRLPIPGADLPNVFVYRNLADLKAIQERALNATSAVVIGGGLLGLEAARALQDLGLRTHVVETSNGLMSRQLNKEGSTLLQQRVRASGILVVTHCITESITSEGDRLTLHFRDGRTLTTDMVIMATGVEARDELAKACGLKIGARSGVLVNEKLQTSDPNIYAIGECALPNGFFYGFAAPGFDMARTVAVLLRGKSARFIPTEYPVRLKLMGIDVITIGDIRGEGTLLSYQNKGSLKQILLTRNRISGVSLLGSTEDVGRLHTAVLKQQRLSPTQRQRFLNTGSPWKPTSDDVQCWPATTTICQCTGVTRGQLSAALSSGCTSIESLSKQTGAGTVCGSCRPLLANLCGAKTAPPTKFARSLLWTCLAVASLTILTLIVRPLPLATSVQTFRLDALWLDSTLKQITGYTLLAIMLLALLLPLRKRLTALAKLGEYSFWRILHTSIGVAVLIALTVHTGFRLGFNLNKVLMLNVLMLSLSGALAGGVISLSHRLSPAKGRLLQTGWTWLHILLCWPLLILILFHILTVYRY